MAKCIKDSSSNCPATECRYDSDRGKDPNKLGLVFLGALIATSIAIMAPILIALPDLIQCGDDCASMKDKLWNVFEWLAITVFVATICAYFFQISRANNVMSAGALIISVPPIILGLIALTRVL